MKIDVECGHCGTMLQVAPEKIGKTIQCRECDNRFTAKRRPEAFGIAREDDPDNDERERQRQRAAAASDLHSLASEHQGEPCPFCGQPMNTDPDACRACGWGRTPSKRSRPRRAAEEKKKGTWSPTRIMISVLVSVLYLGVHSVIVVAAGGPNGLFIQKRTGPEPTPLGLSLMFFHLVVGFLAYGLGPAWKLDEVLDMPGIGWGAVIFLICCAPMSTSVFVGWFFTALAIRKYDID